MNTSGSHFYLCERKTIPAYPALNMKSAQLPFIPAYATVLSSFKVALLYVFTGSSSPTQMPVFKYFFTAQLCLRSDTLWHAVFPGLQHLCFMCKKILHVCMSWSRIPMTAVSIGRGEFSRNKRRHSSQPHSGQHDLAMKACLLCPSIGINYRQLSSTVGGRILGYTEPWKD